MQEIIERYIASWNETDPARRRKLIDEVFAEDATYTDPMADLAGREQIDAGVAGAQAQFAGLVFALAGPVDSNHSQARFTWYLGPEGGEPIVIG
ncbi:MAG TPA: nuclear transport factor 2 family protein, partial [Streptosporangiaceae bacterium]|nr:nuclear transport factor 2 family protein [Streptosporangiaceae bacterium]